MLRLFVSLTIGAENLAQLQMLQRELTLPSLRLVPPSQLHLTLAFLGDVESERLALVKKALGAVAAAAAPFSLTFSHLGCFPERGPARVVWIGTEHEEPRLNALYQSTKQRLHGIQIELESRSYSPHITLARAKTRDEQLRSQLTKIRLPTISQKIDTLQLFRSELDSQGARHELLEDFEFTRAD